MKNALLILLLLLVFPAAPFVMLGCVARSQVVDDLSKSHAETAAHVANNSEALAKTAELVANNTALINKANETISNLAKVQANIAHEIGSAQAPAADKISTIADMNIEITKVHENRANANAGQAHGLADKSSQHAANALDLSDVPSGPQVNLTKLVTDAATGNWTELGLGIISTALLYFGVKQNNKAKQNDQMAKRNFSLAEEMRDLEPTIAREVFKARKQA